MSSLSCRAVPAPAFGMCGSHCAKKHYSPNKPEKTYSYCVQRGRHNVLGQSKCDIRKGGLQQFFCLLPPNLAHARLLHKAGGCNGQNLNLLTFLGSLGFKLARSNLTVVVAASVAGALQFLQEALARVPHGVGKVLVSMILLTQSLLQVWNLPICSFSLYSFFAEEMTQDIAPLWVWKVAQGSLSKITAMLEVTEVWLCPGTGRSSQTKVCPQPWAPLTTLSLVLYQEWHFYKSK